MNYRIVYSNELYHFGVKGMKWGTRKGRQANARTYYKNAKAKLDELNRKEAKEGDALISKSLLMKKGFGKYSNVDDTEYFELVARTEAHLNTDAYWHSVNKGKDYYNSLNKKLYRKGQRLEERARKAQSGGVRKEPEKTGKSGD